MYYTMKKGSQAFFGLQSGLCIGGDFLPFLAKLAHQEADLRPPRPATTPTRPRPRPGLACIGKPIQSESGVGPPPRREVEVEEEESGEQFVPLATGSCSLCFCSTICVGYEDKFNLTLCSEVA